MNETEAALSALKQYGAHVCEAASAVFSALCGRPVRLTLDRIVPKSSSMSTALMSGPCVGMTMQAVQGLAGTQLLIWKTADAVSIAQLILGEASTPGSEISADHCDALLEATNQIGGNLGTALRTALGKPIAFGPGTVAPFADAEACLAAFGKETSVPLIGVTTVKDGDVAFGEVALIVSSSLLPESEKVQSANDAVIVKEGTVSAMSASTQVPFVPLAGGERRVEPNNGIDMLLDVNLQVSVELGRTRLQIRDILQLGPGSIVELDKQAGDAVDILVNDKPIAKGEVIIIDENFGVRLTSITSVADRIKNLR